MKTRIPNFLSNSKPAGPVRKLGACLIVLALLGFTFGKLWAAAEPESAKHTGESAEPGGKIVGTLDGNPQLTVSGHEDKLASYRISPDAKVTLNGVPVKFAALKNDDGVKLVVDKKTNV